MAIRMLLGFAALALTSVATAGTPSDSPSPSDDVATRYCMKVEPLTGSRLETVECWTRAEWAEQGVDVDKDWPKEGVEIRRS